MPTFNQADYIGNAIASVLSQTEKNFELIVVNNYSSDNTNAVVTSFNDDRIKLFNYKNSGIIAASRNFGIKKSKGNYIAFLDSDDIWYPTKLQDCFKYLIKGYNFISHKVYFRNKINYRIKIRLQNKFDLDTLLYNGNFIVTSSVIVKKKLLKKLNGFNVNPDIVNAEDFDLWLRILKYEDGFHVPKILGENTIHQFSASSDIEKSFSAAQNVLISFLQNDKTNKKRKSLGFLSYSFGMAYFKKKRFKPAIDNFITSLKFNPFLIRCYLIIILSYIQIFIKNNKISK